MTVTQADPELINIQILGQDDSILDYIVKKNVKFRKLMDSYCAKTGLVVDTTRFKFNGIILKKDDTPTAMNMENHSVIEIYEEQIGA